MTAMNVTIDDDMPEEMMNGIMRELVMYFVAKAGGSVEVSIDEMGALVQMKHLGIAALGSPEKQILGLIVEDIQEDTSTSELIN
jgi:hypothetical protein